MEQLETRVRVTVLEASLLAAEEALDASVADRKRLREDIDKVAAVVIRLIEQLQAERDERGD